MIAEIIKYLEDKTLTIIVIVVMFLISIAKAIKVVGEDKIKSRALQISSFMFSLIAGTFGWFFAKYISDNPFLLGLIVFASTWKGESMLQAFAEAIEDKFDEILNVNKNENTKEEK